MAQYKTKILYLLDTQIFIWTLISPEKLTTHNQLLLKNNEIFVSQISLFEIAIKQKIGKLPELPLSIEELAERIEQDNFNLLAIALSENMPIISADSNFQYYKNIQLIEN